MTIRTALRTLAVAGLTIAISGLGAGSSRAAAPELGQHDVRALSVDRPVAPAAPASEIPAICKQKKNIVCASLAERTLRYFENGEEQLSTPVIYGRPGYETPKGTWQITAKTPDQWWSYPYKVYMPWGMKFDPKVGLYIHYSSGFALNSDSYVGSHGCIQTRDWEVTKKLYDRAVVGTTVHVY
ncbi:L,D-transpeptidase [Austwickia chelonae]|uniref:L,D-transpeptidase n=1 Tax=Austwickia chelonae TaxID=100225 RepID=UPI0013C311E8|nr:L,D-transpeptidase [Austwickia chelonae]